MNTAYQIVSETQVFGLDDRTELPEIHSADSWNSAFYRVPIRDLGSNRAPSMLECYRLENSFRPENAIGFGELRQSYASACVG